MNTASSLPAIVIGGGINALGVVRSLGSAGVPLIVVDTHARSPAMRSRYGRKLVAPALEGDGLIRFLLGLAGNLPGKPMLFLTEEKTVNTVSLQRAAVLEHFVIRMPDHERLMQLMHKQGFQELAETHAAPVPKTVRLQSMDDLPQLAALQFPCVFKPAKKSYEYGALFKKAYQVRSMEEVAALYREIHPILADMVVQEWIEGDDAEIYFCLQYVGENGEPAASFCGRKLRSWPPRIGGTASCTAAWEDEQELTALTSRFFSQVGFVGMGSMEYKRDSRDGKFYMVEPTVARTDFQEEVATVNGCNLPYAAYCHEMGLPLPQSRPIQPPVIWRDAQAERWSREASGDPADARSSAYPSRDAHWRWNDPRPWWDFMLHRVMQRLGRQA